MNSPTPDPATAGRSCARCGRPMPAESAADAPCPRCLLAAAAGADSIWSVHTELRARDPAPTPEQLRGRFAGLEVLRLIGQGGMGAVYEARQLALDRRVALKLLAPAFTRDAAFVERFTREAQALARLNHPHIVTVHDCGQSGELCYLVMELVEGANLRDVLREGRLAPEQALALVPPICAALQYAHEQGVVHRDIKPENILLDAQGAPKVADFGLAKLMRGGDERMTGSGERMGTPRYMAPEQIERPGSVDHRADIYSLGVVLYEMLTGELPLGRFEPPSRRVRLDVQLDEVVLKALEKAPERRYQRASEMKSRVESVSSGPAGEAARASGSEAPSAPAASAAAARELPEDASAPSLARVRRLAIWGMLALGLIAFASFLPWAAGGMAGGANGWLGAFYLQQGLPSSIAALALVCALALPLALGGGIACVRAWRRGRSSAGGAWALWLGGLLCLPFAILGHTRYPVGPVIALLGIAVLLLLHGSARHAERARRWAARAEAAAQHAWASWSPAAIHLGFALLSLLGASFLPWSNAQLFGMTGWSASFDGWSASLELGQLGLPALLPLLMGLFGGLAALLRAHFGANVPRAAPWFLWGALATAACFVAALLLGRGGIGSLYGFAALLWMLWAEVRAQPAALAEPGAPG